MENKVVPEKTQIALPRSARPRTEKGIKCTCSSSKGLLVQTNQPMLSCIDDFLQPKHAVLFAQPVKKNTEGALAACLRSVNKAIL